MATDYKTALRDILHKHRSDPDKAADEIIALNSKPPLSPWWYSKERLEKLTRP